MIHRSKRVTYNAMIFIMAWGIVWGSSAVYAADADRIQPYSENPFYWQFKGEPVLLLGGSETDGAFQWIGEQLTDHLYLLHSVGGNYIRNVMSDRREASAKPFHRLESGQYDLQQWNEDYFTRLKTFLEETAVREIIVHLTLWDPHDHSHRGVWEDSPWNPVNNVTYDEAESSLPAVPPRPYNPFAFYTTVEDGNRRVLALQESFIERILTLSLQYDHVLYNIMNETWTYIWEGSQWENHWARFIHAQARKIGKTVHVTTMRMKPEASIAAVLQSPDLYSFAEISQNNQEAMGTKGQAHWDVILEWQASIAEKVGPRPLNNVKIYGGDFYVELTRNKAGTPVEAIDRFWRNLLAGCASARFHRTENGWGIGLDERSQKHIRSARMLEKVVDLMRMEPNNDLLSDRDQNEAYCAAIPGSAYAVYFPDSHIMHNFPGHGAVTLDVSAISGPMQVRWLNATNSAWANETTVFEGNALPLRAPSPDCWVAVIKPVE